MTIDVDYIYPQPIGTVSEVDTEIYLIAYKGGGYTGIEAKKGDKQIANLIANADSLADKPIRLIGKLYNTLHNNEHQIADYGSFMRGQLVELGADSELLDYFADYTYISLSEFQSTNRTYIFECVIVSVLAIIFIVMGIFSRKNNIAAYNELYAAYPETKENFNLLMEKADFHDDVLKIIIYGHHLITYYSGFRAIDLNEAEQIYHYVLTMRRGLIANRSSNLTVLRPNTSCLSAISTTRQIFSYSQPLTTSPVIFRIFSWGPSRLSAISPILRKFQVKELGIFLCSANP